MRQQLSCLDRRYFQKLKRTPDIDPLENDLNRPIRSWKSTTPAQERRKYLIVVVHHRAGVDPMGAFQNGTTAIDFCENKESKSLQRWVRVIPV
jgi:hypothetical protein